jgi:hypothetical protein
MTCSAFDVETGLELRLTHGADDVLRSELFRRPHADERLAKRADEWRLGIIEKGFTVLDV